MMQLFPCGVVVVVYLTLTPTGTNGTKTMYELDAKFYRLYSEWAETAAQRGDHVEAHRMTKKAHNLVINPMKRRG